jgi:hypothetical protein
MKLILHNKLGWTKEFCLQDYKTKTDFTYTCVNCESKIVIDIFKATQYENLNLSFSTENFIEFGGTGYLNKLIQCESCTSFFLVGIVYTEPNYGRDVFFLHNIIELEKADIKKEKLSNLGIIIIKKLRDENFDFYLNQKEFANSLTKEDYYKKPRNLSYDPELQKNDDDRFEFLNGLNENQLKQLDKLILGLLDYTAFNFLREAEENLLRNKSIGFTIDGLKVENLTFELLSGTLFGEYLDWCEEKSKFGKYQH